MTRYIEDLNENTAPVSGDYLLCYDASAGSTDKDRKVNISKFAILALANAFTKGQTITPDTTGQVGIDINMPTSTTAAAVSVDYDGADRLTMNAKATQSQLVLHDADLDGDNLGPGLVIGRNTDASLPGAGYIRLANRAGGEYYLWVDQNAKLRIGTTAPINTQDTSGTIVGTQS